jgi:hypothetical protein
MVFLQLRRLTVLWLKRGKKNERLQNTVYTNQELQELYILKDNCKPHKHNYCNKVDVYTLYNRFFKSEGLHKYLSNYRNRWVKKQMRMV